MKTWSKCCPALAALLGLTPNLWAQVPAVPVVPLPPAAPPIVAVAPAPKTGLLGLFEQCAELKAKCKVALCRSPLGGLLNNGLKPVTAVSGGLVPEFCPTLPSPADLAKPPDSAEGAAAQIKKAEAEAKARKAAVRYLGTVDCRWFPEAEAGLVNALRADTNECVRLEAAIALGHGCCCSKKTVAALNMTVSGSNKDGKPSENSERVKAAAMYALQHCLACLSEEITEPAKTPIEPPSPEKPPAPVEKPTAMIAVPPSPYYQAVEKIPLKQVVEEARRTVTEVNKAPAAAAVRHSEDHSLYGMFTRAMNTPASSGTTPIQTMSPTGSAAMLRPEKPLVAVPAPSMAINPAEVSLTPASEPRSFSGSVVQGLTNQGRKVNPDPDSGKAGAEWSASSRPTSLVGWLKTRSSPSSVAMEVTSAQASVAEQSPVPAVQPVVSAPVVPSISSASTLRVEERRDPEFPLPGATKVTVNQLLAVLRKAGTVAQREWAAETLANLNWRENPLVAEMLLKAAREDSAPTVRVECVRSLMKMGVYTSSARAVFGALKNDADIRVRLEAEAALRNLGSN